MGLGQWAMVCEEEHVHVNAQFTKMFLTQVICWAYRDLQNEVFDFFFGISFSFVKMFFLRSVRPSINNHQQLYKNN
jgi:hypothetical protein